MEVLSELVGLLLKRLVMNTISSSGKNKNTIRNFIDEMKIGDIVVSIGNQKMPMLLVLL